MAPQGDSKGASAAVAADAYTLGTEVQPGTKLSTLDEVFDFVQCATDEPVLFNIESKINPVQRNETRSAAEFVAAMGKIFTARGDAFLDRITHQSFDVCLLCSYL